MGSGETDMNRSNSHRDYENHRIYDGSPLHGSPSHGGQGVFFEFIVTGPQQICPFRAAHTVPDGERRNNPALYPDTTIFR